MDFIDSIKSIAARIERQADAVKTEEATKTSFVMPFIHALGYDIFDPSEVVPEFTADIGVKKGEKVDYAIMRDGRPIILIECKYSGINLNKSHTSQLSRYFHVTDAHFAILTNGIEYKFYSDLDQDNKMDQNPFLEFSMLDFQESEIPKLKQFTKSSFDPNTMLEIAKELKYASSIRSVFIKELSDPSDDFILFFAKQIHSGRVTANIKNQFSILIKKTLREYINEQITRRLSSALDSGDEGIQPEEPTIDEEDAPPKEPENDIEKKKMKGEIITTEEEVGAFEIVKAILGDVIDVSRVAIRDGVRYCGVLLDDNNRKPLARFHFNTSNWYLGVFDEKKKEQKILIKDIEDIYNYKDRILIKITHYDG